MEGPAGAPPVESSRLRKAAAFLVKGFLALIGTFLAFVAFCGVVFVFYFRGGRHARVGEQDQYGNIGAINGALAVYYGDNEGKYPTRFEALLQDGKYLHRIPELWSIDNEHLLVHRPLVPHPDTREVQSYPSLAPGDSGKWGYVNDPLSKDWGTVFIDCTHSDTKGQVFSSY